VAPPGSWLARLEDHGVTALVAEGGGELLGFVTCGENRDPDTPPETGELRTMFVSPRRWRAGVGRALLAAALDDLDARGYSEVTLWSFADNGRANGFYEAAGFARDGTERTEDAWAHILEVRYRRSL
jgi:ribosomal protein S18 acetylase RimI-like enzyme